MKSLPGLTPIPHFSAGRLDERPLAAIVVSTHAPSDTAVLRAHFAVAVDEDQARSVFAYVLLDPKLGLLRLLQPEAA